MLTYIFIIIFWTFTLLRCWLPIANYQHPPTFRIIYEPRQQGEWIYTTSWVKHPYWTVDNNLPFANTQWHTTTLFLHILLLSLRDISSFRTAEHVILACWGYSMTRYFSMATHKGHIFMHNTKATMRCWVKRIPRRIIKCQYSFLAAFPHKYSHSLLQLKHGSNDKPSLLLGSILQPWQYAMAGRAVTPVLETGKVAGL